MATGERSARGRPIAARLMTAALRLFSHIHLLVYRHTGGAIAGRIYGNPVLLLTTTGRKTGKKRTTPLAYLNDDDTMIIIGGSAGGVEHPAWWLNLQANPEAEVQVGRRTLRVRATEATQQEQQRLWSRYPSMQARFAFMQRRMSRKIPVIVLHPLPSAEK
jgi:deazaflavin-dependent oxidoreductase (nitroreductase family)